MPSSPKMTKVKGHPAIYRRGGRYVAVGRDAQGRQVKKFARTIAEAEDRKAEIRVAAVRGERLQRSKMTFGQYAEDWLGSYGGRTQKGIREETREDYRKRLEQDAIPFLGRLRLTEIEPSHLDALAGRVAKRGVSASTVRGALAPLRALLATAHARGDITANPAAGYRVRWEQDAETIDGNDVEKVKALTDDELTRLLNAIREQAPAAVLFFEFLAATALRVGEAVEVRWDDLDLGARTLKVRRRFYRGRVAPPKSRYGVRTVRLSAALAQQLWLRWADERPAGADLVFTSERGERLDQSNLMSRTLKPAAVAAGLGVMVDDGKGGQRPESWVGFHTFRHSCATRLFRGGWNAVQVQRWLGHHKPSFTLDTYVHLIDEDIPDPTFLDASPVGNTWATGATETSREADAPSAGEVAI